MRLRPLAAVAASVMVLVPVVPAWASAATGDLSQGAKQPVIVVLKDQHPDTPVTKGDNSRRQGLTRSDQQPLVDQAKQTGAADVKQFSVVNGFSAKLTGAEQQHLATDPRVQAVYPDLAVRKAETPKTVGQAAASGTASGAGCPTDPAKPLLEPEALQTTHVADDDASKLQAATLATGKGVKVAYIADGIDIDNPDLKRADGSRVFSDYQDFSGEGTAAPGADGEAFGDASAIAAQGRQTYDLSDWTNAAAPLPKGCTIRIRGVAPDASLVGLKAIASNGFGTTSAIVQALDYAVNVDKVDVINESLGSNPYPDNNTDPWSVANRAAIAAGVTIVASSGDSGVTGTVGNVASDPAIIAAGASTTFRSYAELDSNLPGFSGKWVSGNISAISSGGTTERGRVVDLVAPGDLGWALCSPNPTVHRDCVNGKGQPAPIESFGGTSMASPLIAGAAALVIEAYERSHHGVRPAPQLVKQLLTSTATDNLDPSDRQGAGQLNAYEAVRAALSVKDGNGSPAAQGNNLVVNQTQILAEGNPGQLQAKDLTVTNTGASTQTVSAHNRTLTKQVSDEHTSVAIDGTSTTVPTWANAYGSKYVYVNKTFTVPAGADHLDASLAYPPAGPRIVTMWLLDPSGTLTGYTIPQGLAGYGHIDVHSPKAGNWTAVVSVRNAPNSVKGTIPLEFATSKYVTTGTVFPSSLTLKPGQSGTFHVLASNPDNPGDLPAAVQLNSDKGTQLAVPLILRTKLPSWGGSFTGTLTGGNGRPGGPAQTNVYRFDVPRGQRDLGLDVTLAGDPNQVINGYLVSPDGQLLSAQNNVLTLDANGNPAGYGRSVQVYRRDPAPGRWTFVIAAANPVAGTATSQKFSGSLRYDVVDAKVAVPHTLPAGKPTTVQLQVRNTGKAALSYFVDARSTKSDDLQVLPLNQAANVPLPQFTATKFLVPTETTSLTSAASASEPIDLDLSTAIGLPEVLKRSGVGNVAIASLTSPQLTPGLWLAQLNQIGPFQDPAKANTANIGLVAHTQVFDPAVTSSTGNAWLGTVQANAPAATPLVLQPGQTGTISVTITPTAAKGSTVSGVLYLDDYSAFASAGDSLKAFPYSYTVG
ncbi:S8 family peptidase [Kutzneria chonburiensis]|uniref:S8 family serine peptidase n=1 Tax=Kutzneria chonburiensis TaxID=1483604 RepID=A0ABV6N5C8_9PSEU|nr:S8 family serine peptidase [Kutzneria chonburiensis]